MLIVLKHKSCEPLYLLRLNGHVSAIPTYRVSGQCNTGTIEYTRCLIYTVQLRYELLTLLSLFHLSVAVLGQPLRNLKCTST